MAARWPFIILSVLGIFGSGAAAGIWFSVWHPPPAGQQVIYQTIWQIPTAEKPFDINYYYFPGTGPDMDFKIGSRKPPNMIVPTMPNGAIGPK